MVRRPPLSRSRPRTCAGSAAAMPAAGEAARGCREPARILADPSGLSPPPPLLIAPPPPSSSRDDFPPTPSPTRHAGSRHAPTRPSPSTSRPRTASSSSAPRRRTSPASSTAAPSLSAASTAAARLRTAMTARTRVCGRASCGSPGRGPRCRAPRPARRATVRATTARSCSGSATLGGWQGESHCSPRSSSCRRHERAVDGRVVQADELLTDLSCAHSYAQQLSLVFAFANLIALTLTLLGTANAGRGFRTEKLRSGWKIVAGLMVLQAFFMCVSSSLVAYEFHHDSRFAYDSKLGTSLFPLAACSSTHLEQELTSTLHRPRLGRDGRRLRPQPLHRHRPPPRTRHKGVPHRAGRGTRLRADRGPPRRVRLSRLVLAPARSSTFVYLPPSRLSVPP